MLDCEYETKSPAQMTAMTGIAAASGMRLNQSSATITAIATARCRP